MEGAQRDNKGQGASARGDGGSPRRLRSWKEIAAFFGTDARTVKRWEARGLPVQRVPGGARTPVFADTADLDQWIRGGSGAPAVALEPASVPRRRASGRAMAAATALMLALAGGAAGLYWLRAGGAERSAPTIHQPPPEAAEAYLAGAYHLERRTPESLRRALDQFGRAIARDPDYAEAYAGLANCYLMLREYAGMPQADAYARARAAAGRALALDPNLADAQAALAFATFFGSWDFEGGRRGFARAAALAPGNARVQHWYATALLHIGDSAAALAHIDAAQRLEPQSRAILADKGLILYYAGHADEGVALLRELERLEPDFLSPHAYLALIHLAGRDYRAYLREDRETARLRGDAARVARLDEAGRALARGGGAAMLHTLLAGELRLHAADGGHNYELAALHALLGERGPALSNLREALRRREAIAVGLRIDLAFRGFAADPAFRLMAARVGA